MMYGWFMINSDLSCYVGVLSKILVIVAINFLKSTCMCYCKFCAMFKFICSSDYNSRQKFLMLDVVVKNMLLLKKRNIFVIKFFIRELTWTTNSTLFFFPFLRSKLEESNTSKISTLQEYTNSYWKKATNDLKYKNQATILKDITTVLRVASWSLVQP